MCPKTGGRPGRRFPTDIRADLTGDPQDGDAMERERRAEREARVAARDMEARDTACEQASQEAAAAEVTWLRPVRAGFAERVIVPRVNVNPGGVLLTRSALELFGDPEPLKLMVGVVGGRPVLRRPGRGGHGYTVVLTFSKRNKSKRVGGGKVGTPALIKRLQAAGVPVPSSWTPEWNEEMGWLECRREEEPRP